MFVKGDVQTEQMHETPPKCYYPLQLLPAQSDIPSHVQFCAFTVTGKYGLVHSGH